MNDQDKLRAAVKSIERMHSRCFVEAGESISTLAQLAAIAEEASNTLARLNISIEEY